MARGSPVVCMRLTEAFLGELDARICEINRNRKGKPLNRTDFIFDAIMEKLNKMERSRGSEWRWSKRFGRFRHIERKLEAKLY